MTAVITGIIPQFQDSSGFALTNGQLYAYVPGTTTAKTIYTNDTLTTAHTQPIVLNARGEPPSPLYTAFGDAYKFVLQDEFGATLYTADNVTTQGTVTQATVGSALWPTSTLENANGVTPTDFSYEPGDIRRYGALVDGATDDSTAFQNAINSGHPVWVPEGTTIINSALTATATTTIRGAGIGKTIIDGTGITTTTDGVITIQGALTQVSDLSSDPAKFDLSLAFNSDPVIGDGDIGLIWNPTDSSYSSHRTSYYAGEFFQAQSTSGTTVSTTGRLYSAYTAANVDVYRLNMISATMADFTVLAPANATPGVKLTKCVTSSLSNVECQGSTVASIRIDKCYDVGIVNCRGIYLDTTGASNDYGLSISNCQKVRVNGGHYVSRRHSVTVGGDSLTGAVVNREVIVDGANLTNFTDQGAADFHGNVEHSSYQNCIINGSSASFGGNFNSFRGNRCFGDTQTSCIAVGEASGLDLTIEGNTFDNYDGGAADRGWGIDLSGNSLAFSTGTEIGGTFRIANNQFINRTTAAPTSDLFARISNAGYIGGDTIRFEFIGNTIRAGQAQGNTLRIDSQSGDEWDDVLVSGNMMYQGDILIVSGTGAITVTDNKIFDPSTVAGSDGINIIPASGSPTIIVGDNYVASATDDGITVSGTSTTSENVVLKGNVVNGAGDDGIGVVNVATVHLLGNTVLAATGNAIDVNTVTTMTAIGNNAAVTKTSVTTDIEFGSDGADLIMVGLPTGNPGAGKLWANTNVVTVGT